MSKDVLGNDSFVVILFQDAAKSFGFYRNANVESKEVVDEMEKLRQAFNPDFEDGKYSILTSLRQLLIRQKAKRVRL